jgi:hypothetical protein
MNAVVQNLKERQKIFHLQQSNMERVGKFSFTNRLNDIIPLLSDRDRLLSKNGSLLSKNDSLLSKNDNLLKK